VPLNRAAPTVSDREGAAAFHGRWSGLAERVHDDEHLPHPGIARRLSPGVEPARVTEGRRARLAVR
jgi:hypothetical protein